MIALKNLKNGKSTQHESGAVVHKDNGGYQIVRDELGSFGSAYLQYDRKSRSWLFSAPIQGQNELNIVTEGTGEEALEAGLAAWSEATQKPEPVEEPEATPAVEPGEEPSEAAPEYEATWDVAIDVKGGMGPHRLAAAMALAASLGAVTTVTKTKAENGGYKGTTTLHVHGDADTIALVQLALPMFMQEAEKGGWNLSKDASRRTRLAGIHHSLGGFNARAAYARGFAGGVIEALELELEDTNLVDKGSDLDKGAWRLGMDEGKVFGAEQLKELVNA